MALAMAATYAGGVASGGKTTVLLPSYLSTTMIRPFSEIGFQVEFYPVAADLSIDPAELLARCNSGTAAILVMHYFGFHQRHDLIELVHDQFPDLPVIDDRTHMLLSDLRAQNRESSRALTVYSVRKWGPFPDLGQKPTIDLGRLHKELRGIVRDKLCSRFSNLTCGPDPRRMPGSGRTRG